MQNLIATTFEVVHYIALQAVHYKPLQEVHLSRYNQVTGEEMQKYRDSLTEGYNVTPNFFIRNGVPDGKIEYADPQLKANKNIKGKPPVRHVLALEL